jgi:hypothetical protein
VSRAPLPTLLKGKELLAAGLEPGPEVGVLLARLREEQLSGRLSTPEEAARWVAEQLRHSSAAGT